MQKKIKTGIITFHWGANHGAVLQVFALSRFLQNEYAMDVDVINYYPRNLEYTFFGAIRQIHPRMILQKLRENQKERVIRPFRQNLNLTKRYYTNDELIRAKLPYDVLLAGSDQIWNPSFLRGGEGNVTPVYYLNFGGDAVRKVSVSASFGCRKFPKDCQELAEPLLKQFSAISVRENTGADILRAMGLEATVTADPTALLPREVYLELCKQIPSGTYRGVCKMILRKQSRNVRTAVKVLCQRYSSHKAKDIQYLSVPEWLAAIRDSEMVVTNSFHCVMMCLKLHTQFVVLLEEGALAGMNDRFVTLLEKFDLTNRIVYMMEDALKDLPKIDFEQTDIIMEQYASSLKDFLKIVSADSAL